MIWLNVSVTPQYDVKAGFEIIEIHGAAGCIPTNFLSPHDNKRTDMYGGSLHNRMRLLLEIVRNIKRNAVQISR